MPAPGEQHGSIANPFEEAKPRISEFTAQEIATLQSRLEKQLGPEFLSARTGPSGQKVHYIAAEKCIALANEVFGFNGWSSSIQNIQVDFVDENPQTLKISLGLSVVVRVTLRDGTFHEDIGYGHIENCKGKAAAFEKAKKEGTTDALKRALRSFGNVLGNCIYDKAYLQKVTKMKVGPTRFDESSLHRHGDFVKKEEKEAAPKLEASNAAVATLCGADSFEDLLGEFDEADFNVVEDGHPDEIALLTGGEKPQPSNQQDGSTNGNAAAMQPPTRPLGRSASAGNYPKQPQTPTPAPSRGGPAGGPQGQHGQSGPRPPPQHNGPNQNSLAHQTPPGGPPPIQGHGGPGGPAVGFYSAKAVNHIVGGKEDAEPQLPQAPQVGQVFNPRAESPSIRKTPGIDHTKSKPVGRNGQHVVLTERAPETAANPAAGRAAPAAPMGGRPSAGPPQPSQRGNVLNPHMDQMRRIGAPGGGSSPLANRGQYRPPTMKRPLPAEAGGAEAPGRPALAEVTANGTVNGVASAAGLDAKRQKTGN